MRSMHRLQPNRVVCAVAWMVVAASIGCDRTAELANQDRQPERVGKLVASSAKLLDREAVAWLEKTAAAYARVTSYEDSGRVVLSYKFDGKHTQDIAPLAVAYESPNRLGMKAYQVLAGSTQTRLHLKVESKSPYSPLSKQVLSRELPKQLNLPWLMSDPIAVEHWSAGLAGSPPQLELLLGEQPFRALLDGATEVVIDGQGTDGGQTYQIVKVMRSDAKYRLWISASTSLLRRIELPTATLPEAMRSDSHIADIRMSIELDDPRIGTRIDWSKWQVVTQPLDQLVRNLIMPPLVNLDPRLGKALPAFRLPACEDKLPGLDTSAAAGMGQVQVLLWLADHPSCRATLDQLNQALARLPEPIRQRIAPAVVWAEPEPPAELTFAALKKEWHIDMPLVKDSGEVGRDILAISEAPAVLVLDGKHRLQFMQQHGSPMLVDILPDMLMRLSRGENLARAAQEQAQLQQSRFEAALWRARASDANAGAFTQPNAYAFGSLTLEEVAVQPVKELVAGFQADALRNLWLLRADGKLLQLSPNGKVEAELGSGLDSVATKQLLRDRTRLATDDAANFVAILTQSNQQLQIVERVNDRASAIRLSDQKLTDLRWLETPAGLRLAAITQTGKTLLIDPSRFEQHSGQSDAMPLAILPRVAEEALTSGYVILDDGRIEPIIVQDEGGAKAAVLGQTKAPGPSKTTSPKLGQVTSAAGNSGDKSADLSSSLSSSGAVLKHLQFSPARGPWVQWRDAKHTRTLARGWLASDEPAVFVLDDKLQQVWHAPLAIQDGADIVGSTVSIDPVTQQPMWVIATADSTLHVFRADGQLVDDCRLADNIRGVALVPVGQELRLWVAHDDRLIHYRIQPR